VRTARKGTRSGIRLAPAVVAIAATLVGLVVLLLINHGPWSKTSVSGPPTQITTEIVAENAGAKVTPTIPDSPVAPTPPGPTPANPPAGPHK
jgi:hypothetical protein